MQGGLSLGEGQLQQLELQREQQQRLQRELSHQLLQEPRHQPPARQRQKPKHRQESRALLTTPQRFQQQREECQGSRSYQQHGQREELQRQQTPPQEWTMPLRNCSAPAEHQMQFQHRGHRRMPLDGLGLVLQVDGAPGTWSPEGLLPESWEHSAGTRHQFHTEAGTMGDLSRDQRSFTKRLFDGRLSVVTESFVNYEGRLEYLVQFSGGELSSADGVGFILSPKLPCPKNIQKITSIFANRTGRICVRANSEVVRSDVSIRPLEVGDLVSVVVDLDRSLAQFTIWPTDGEAPSTALFDFGTALERLRARIPNVSKCRCGYFACVIKNAGVSVQLGS